MKYRVHIESWNGGNDSREFEIFSGNGLDGDQPGVEEAHKMVKWLFPEAITNIQVDPHGDSDWWDLQKWETRKAEEDARDRALDA